MDQDTHCRTADALDTENAELSDISKARSQVKQRMAGTNRTGRGAK